MAINPMDLQTLFVRLSQVGREQSAIRQAVDQNQLVTGQEIAEHSKEVEETVSEAEDVSDGTEKVDDQSNPQHRGEDEHRSPEQDIESSAEAAFEDPDLGQNIDLQG